MTATSCLLLAFSSAPKQKLLGSFQQVRVTRSPRTSGSLSACYWVSVVSETGLGILGKWASRQLVGLSHAGGSQMEQDQDEEEGGWATSPATVVPVSVASAGSVPRE